MGNLTNQITDMVEQLQEPEQILIMEIVKRFLPDDVATYEDLIDIAVARKEYLRGEAVDINDIDWN